MSGTSPEDPGTGAPTIRPGESADLAALVRIYNHYITETPITFDTESYSIGARTQWFTQFAATGPYRLLVAELDRDVIGYASSVRFKPKPAYATSVETTVYIDPRYVGRGFGRMLYGALLDELKAERGLHRAYGGVALPNEASVTLHKELGFQQVAIYTEVGFKFGRYWNVAWFEKEV